MRRLRAHFPLILALGLVLTGALPAALAQAPDPPKDFDGEKWKGLEWREVGPYRGGRSAAVTGIPGR